MMSHSQTAFRWLATLAFAAMLGVSGCAHRHATKAPMNQDAATLDAPAAGSSPTARWIRGKASTAAPIVSTWAWIATS